MLYNVKQSYTPALELHELNQRALVIDTETVGSGQTIEVIEIAIGNVSGDILLESLVRPVFNRLPSPSKHHRFDQKEFTSAPYWTDIWPKIAELINNKLLIAYNANFDRRALSAMAARHSYASPERGWRCAMQLVKKGIGVKKSLTLSAACAYFGLEGGNHRAACDVQATCRLLQTLQIATIKSKT
jgi:DNA polymerase III subunit epsilon